MTLMLSDKILDFIKKKSQENIRITPDEVISKFYQDLEIDVEGALTFLLENKKISYKVDSEGLFIKLEDITHTYTTALGSLIDYSGTFTLASDASPYLINTTISDTNCMGFPDPYIGVRYRTGYDFEISLDTNNIILMFSDGTRIPVMSLNYERSYHIDNYPYYTIQVHPYFYISGKFIIYTEYRIPRNSQFKLLIGGRQFKCDIISTELLQSENDLTGFSVSFQGISIHD